MKQVYVKATPQQCSLGEEATIQISYQGFLHSFITQVEKGKTTASTHVVLKIADLFGVTPDQLMRDEQEVDG